LKDFKNKIQVIFLALVVLFSSSFIVIDEHYCGGELQGFSMFGKAEVCEADMSTCESKNINNSISEDNCCSNVQQIKIGSIFEHCPAIKINFDKLLDVPTINYYKYNLQVSLIVRTFYLKEYIPPLISRDILVFFECFRI